MLLCIFISISKKNKTKKNVDEIIHTWYLTLWLLLIHSMHAVFFWDCSLSHKVCYVVVKLWPRWPDTPSHVSPFGLNPINTVTSCPHLTPGHWEKKRKKKEKKRKKMKLKATQESDWSHTTRLFSCPAPHPVLMSHRSVSPLSRNRVLMLSERSASIPLF